MRPGAVLACAVLLAAGCKKRGEQPPEPPAPRVEVQERLRAQLEATRSAAAGVADAGVADAGVADAGVADGPGADAASSDAVSLDVRLNGYAKLLAIDVSLFQTVQTYPGAPEGTTFSTSRYGWSRPNWMPLDTMWAEVAGVLASISAAPSLTSADAAVRAYAEVVAAWIPRLSALAAYYDGDRFIDDEFDRGRKEAPALRSTASAIATLRAPMRAAVFKAWRGYVADFRDTPRALAAHAWMACMSIADRVIEKARPDAIAKALSECRRAVPPLTGSAATAGFAADVRRAAGELGNWVSQDYYPSWSTQVSNELGQLTLSYVALWPKLPSAPAERSPAP